MNSIAILRQGLAYFGYAMAFAFVFGLVLFFLRHPLHALYVRWRSLGGVARCLSLVFITGFVLYGGSKNLPPAQTNDAQNAYGPLLSASSVEALSASSLELRAKSLEQSSPQPTNQQTPQLKPLSSHLSSLTSIATWRSRGAWVDWQRIEFPDGFAFPIVTNQIMEVTLMSYGELRTSLNQPTNQQTNQPTTNHALVSLPSPVALEPGESSVHYGLTASNSFLVVWENACVERSATNRVDASIELFRNGDTLVTLQPLSQPSQPTVIFTPAAPPDEFVGEGQDADWANAAFPSNATAIAEMGYDNWLADYIGVNEPNGRYQVKITVPELPDGPCYLVCGPYRMVVKTPGVYCFPLEYFEEYTVRTYPEAVPLTFEYDEGLQLDPEWRTGNDATPAASAPRRSGLPTTEYKITRFPEVFIKPNYIPLDEARARTINLFCKAANIESYDYTTWSGRNILYFTSPSTAVILEAIEQDEVDFILSSGGYVGSARLTIGPPTGISPFDPPFNPSSTNDWGDSTNTWHDIGGTNTWGDVGTTNANGSASN